MIVALYALIALVILACVVTLPVRLSVWILGALAVVLLAMWLI